MDIPMSNYEKKIHDRVDVMIGDPAINTILKMALLDYNDDEINCIIQAMKANNDKEKLMIDNEMNMTYDASGNMVYIK
jgi:hypothetical protein